MFKTIAGPLPVGGNACGDGGRRQQSEQNEETKARHIADPLRRHELNGRRRLKHFAQSGPLGQLWYILYSIGDSNRRIERAKSDLFREL